jgi:hypothetical protein
MLQVKKWIILTMALTLVSIGGVTVVTAEGKSDVQGLVFIDDNRNGVWDPDEAGYGGEMQWDAVIEMDRYVGTTVTIITPAYDEFAVETSPYRAPEEWETVVCTQQDLLIDGEINPNPIRPCSGTWGLPVVANETYLEIWVTAPEGYYITSQNPQYFLTGTDESWVDFGIAPIAAGEGGIGGPVTSDGEDVVDHTPLDETAVAPTTWTMDVVGNVVPGLVFIDSNGDGVWQPGEPGYGGELTWIEDEGVLKYVGATVTLISPAYDEFVLTSAGYVAPEEDETITCTQQDLVIGGEINSNPVRPCDGTWGLSHAGEDVFWEVRLTVPDGYALTSANPQYYNTGSGQLPLDFGIVPFE